MYGIVNGPAKENRDEYYWYFCSDELNFSVRLCLFDDKDLLIENLRHQKIGDVTIEEIFDNLLYNTKTLYIL